MQRGDIYHMRLRVCDNGYYLEWGLKPPREGDMWAVSGALVAKSPKELSSKLIAAFVQCKIEGEKCQS